MQKGWGPTRNRISPAPPHVSADTFLYGFHWRFRQPGRPDHGLTRTFAGASVQVARLLRRRGGEGRVLDRGSARELTWAFVDSVSTEFLLGIFGESGEERQKP